MKITIEINGEEHTFDLSDDTAAALQAIAARNGLTLETALLQAITNENFLEQTDGKLLIEKNGTLRELVRKPEPA